MVNQREQPFPMEAPADDGSAGDDENSNELTLETLGQQVGQQATDLTTVKTLLQNLSTTVGRVQSIADRQAAAPDPSPVLEEELDSRLSGMTEMMAQLASVLDDDVIGPEGMAVKQKVIQAYNDLQAQVSKRDAVKELMDALQERGVIPNDDAPSSQAPPANDAQQTATDWDTFQSGLIQEIRDFGLDPEDQSQFQWTDAVAIVRRGGTPEEVAQLIRGNIRSALAGSQDGSDGDDEVSDSDMERAARAAAARGGGAPPSGAGTQSIAQRLANAKSPAETKEILRDIGALQPSKVL